MKTIAIFDFSHSKFTILRICRGTQIFYLDTSRVKMKMKFMILLLSLFVLRKTYGYVFSRKLKQIIFLKPSCYMEDCENDLGHLNIFLHVAEIDRLIIYNEQYTAYTACQASIPALQVALLANVSLDNVPSRPIMDKDVPFNVYTRLVAQE